jgi:RNA polymerase sigma factor (sigma-70 family)
MSMTDPLRQYIESGSDEAFRLIVEMHIDSVYSQCVRQLRDRTLAEDVTQSVFILLARKAAKIPKGAVLGGWLFNATHYACANARRTANRRAKQEQKAARMRQEIISSPQSNDTWSEVEPYLDDAIARLATRERDAILLRFFQNQSMRDVGTALGISEDAAKQRVFRAMEKLRGYFADRGLAMPSVTLAACLQSAVKPAAPNMASVTVAIATTKMAGRSWSILSWPKIAAAIAAVMLLSTAAIVGEHLALADASSPAPIAAAPAPAIQSPDQSTPAGALRKLSLAIRADNSTAIDACLTDDGTDSESAGMVRAYFHEQGAVYRLEHAWMTAFKEPMHIPEFSFATFTTLDGGFETLFDKTLDAPGGPQIKIDGNTATIRIGLPPELFVGTGIDRRPELGRWSGAMLVMSQVKGQWKLNTDQSFTFILNINAPRGTQTRMALTQKVEQAFHDVLDKIAADIDTGTIATPASAASISHTACMEVFQECGVRGNSIAIMPVIGGSTPAQNR